MFLFSPLAGYIAHVKIGRLKILLCGTFAKLLPLFSCLIVVIVLVISSYSSNSTGQMLIDVVGISFIIYGFGEIVFLSNIVQFGTDQLRDAPTRYSIYFICAYILLD